MGFKLLINGTSYRLQEYTVQEAATPLAAGDSSGQVGSITFSIPFPDYDLNPTHPFFTKGLGILAGADIHLEDERKGYIVGKVDTVARSRDSGVLSITATSRLGELNIFNVQAQPFTGTLSEAFTYYLSLAGITSNYLVDPEIVDRQVAIPGWSGELWSHLKQFTVAYQCDISLVSGVILLRPLRERLAVQGRDLTSTASFGGGSLAQSVEVYWYQNRKITRELVYPPGGWSEEVPVINVNAGETIEEILELSASLYEIEQPEMQFTVGQHHTSSSVYTITGDDGLNVDPAMWHQFGGSLKVSINEDTKSLTVEIKAPLGLPSRSGKEALTSFGVSLASEDGTGRYSTLRLRGSGVAFDRVPVKTLTGLTKRDTGTDVGVTIDNPFMTRMEDVHVAGAWAARGFNGSNMSLTGDISAINKYADPGIVRSESYEFDQTVRSGKTYNTVQVALVGGDYARDYEYINSLAPIDYDEQVFGNVNGTRVWDQASARWYRIREGTTSPLSIQFSADDDLTHSDTDRHFQGKTYGSIQTQLTGANYRAVDLLGLR